MFICLKSSNIEGDLFLRLNETCRMIGYSLLSNDANFVEIGFKWL